MSTYVFKKIKSKELQFDRRLWIGMQWSHLTSWILSKEESLVYLVWVCNSCFPPLIQATQLTLCCSILRGQARTALIGTKEFLIVMNDWLAVFHEKKNTVREISLQIHLLMIMKITHFLQREIHKYLVKPKMGILTK